MAGLAFMWNWIDMAVGVLLCFVYMLRPGEMLALKIGDIFLPASLAGAQRLHSLCAHREAEDAEAVGKARARALR
eukprot:6069817-Heterocapsa_arctica.AAC.1